MRKKVIVKLGVQALLVFVLSFAIWSCGGEKNGDGSKADFESNEISTEEIREGKALLAEVFKAHGGKKFSTANYKFVFREKVYTFKNDGDHFKYTKTFIREGSEITDTYSDLLFERRIDGELANLSEKEVNGISNSLNSVIYFATLPHKLRDPAVKLAYKGEVSMYGNTYKLLKVTFAEDGGGKDFDDEYLYWINSETNRIDFLAYNYSVNEGGVRFRRAYNSRVIDGVLFQDYINFKAEVGTPLKDLIGLYVKNKLERLSVIETENVKSLKEG